MAYMAILKWDQTGEKTYETGVKKGVLYPQDIIVGNYPAGVAWNGLTAVTESPSGAEATKLYADDAVYLSLMSAEVFGGTVEAYTYPEEFEACDGSAEMATGVVIGQQKRQPFGLAYRTSKGNDLEGTDFGYKLHLIYGCLASPSEKAYATVNDAPEAITFSWTIATTPVEVGNFKPTATLIIDSTKVDPTALATLEGILYGTDITAARLPLPVEVAALFAAGAPSAVALSTIVPADDATAIAINANVVITFNNKILSESVVVASELGEIVLGSKTWDVTGKILTFYPTSDLTNSTLYIVTVGGVIDIYGQALAAVVKNFETVGA